MKNATQTRPPRQRKPQVRSLKLLAPPMESGCNAVLRITAGKLVQTYFVDRIPSDWGEAFSLTKTDSGEVYHVHLTAEGHTCDCLGHSRWGHCKHADGIALLKSRSAL